MKTLGLIPIFIISSVALFAQEASPVTADSPAPVKSAFTLVAASGLNWQGQSYSTVYSEGAPLPNGIEASPLFIQSGVLAHYAFSSTDHLGFGLDFFVDDYVYIANLERAFPTQAETGSEVGPLATVLALIPRVNYGFDIALSEKSSLGISLGLAFLLRIPVAALDNSTGIEVIGDYLNRNFKFLYPEIGISARFPLAKGLQFGPWIRTMVPLCRLWDGENLPFWDTWMVSGGIFVEIDL